MFSQFQPNLSQPVLQLPEVKPILPIELTPLIAEGAVMEPIAIHADWPDRQLFGACRDVQIPTGEVARASLWMEDWQMEAVRNHVVYECHDLRVVKCTNGELSLLVCRRVEPNPATDGIELAPINGFWWSTGGRREVPKPNSPLEGKFELVHSVLKKANREAGIQPSDVLGIYDLGVGRTEFSKEMRYVSRAQDDNGEAIEASRTVTLRNPQRTINRNFLVHVSDDAVVADQSVERLTFLSQREYADPVIRARFCPYEQAFMDAIFAGWRGRNGFDS